MEPSRIPHQTASVPVEGGGVPVFHTAGSADPGPALVVAPSVFGITDDLVPQLRELSSGAGLVVAMDLFWRDDPGPVAYTDMPTVMRRLQTLDYERAYADWRAVVAWARADRRCNGRVVGLGICFGGPFCFRGAADRLLDAVITWHGTRLEACLDRASDMRCPMALHFGEKDWVVPPDAVARVRGAFADRDDVRIVVHPGADHGYSHPGAPTADPVARAASMDSVRELLDGLR